MHIRQAMIDDAGGIANVHVASWQTTYIGILPTEFLAGLNPADRGPILREQLTCSQPGPCVFVAEDDSGVVGFASGGRERTGDTEFDGELFAIYLLARSQGQGLGCRLVHNVAGTLIEHGRVSLLVWALKDNPSRRFYERLGGLPVRERTITIAGTSLIEIAYGWRELRDLLDVTRQSNCRS